MAIDKPAKAPPLYEGGHDKSTDVPDGISSLREAQRKGNRCQDCFVAAPMTNGECVKYAAIAFLVLTACSQQPEKAPDSKGPRPAPATPQPIPPRPAPTPFSFDEENELIEFHFGWSAEAAEVPELVRKFQADLQKAKANLLKRAKDHKAMREKDGQGFTPYMSATSYETAGQSQKLLSLRAEVGDYTGGAHGNHGTRGLLWDRARAREVQVTSLFAEPSNMGRLLTQRWCDALNAERAKRRGEPAGDGMFDDCPRFDDLAVIPSDGTGNGPFDNILIVASPYVAGPYSEGAYEIQLSVTPDLIAALKDEYRGEFEARQTQ
jgi:hypothetical protein